jgi:beta-glucosidase
MAHRTYRYFDGPVLYPFGFGLSYARFIYGAVHLSSPIVSAGSPLTATVTLNNESDIAGTEVSEIYIVPPQIAGAPHLALAGTQRVTLGARESKEIKFMLDPAQMSFVDPEGRRAIRSGSYRIFIGGAQPQLNKDKGAEFRIAGEKAMDF